MMSIDYGEMDEIAAEYQEAFKKKVRQVQKQYDTIIKDMRNQVFDDAAKFVSSQAVDITAYLTKEHHKMIEQYYMYKQQTQDKLDLFEEYKEKFIHSTMLYAQKAPAMEASFAMSENSSLKLYNCLMPFVREHEYATWIKCRMCKKKREEEGHRDLMISME